MQPVFPPRPTAADAAHRLRRGRGRPRPARGPGRGRREHRAAGAGRPARSRSRAGSGDLACASSPAATSTWRASTMPRCSRERGEDYYRLGRRRGCRASTPRAEMRRNGTLIAAMLVREGKADGMLCGTFGRYATHLKYIAEVIGRREGACGIRGHASADAAAADGLHLRHLHQPRPDGRADGRDGACSRPRTVRRFGLDAAGGAAVPLELRHRRHARRRARCATRWRPDPGARPGPRGRGRDACRCRALQAASWTGRMPELAADRRGEPADHAEPGRRQHHLQRAEDRRGRGRDGRPDPAGRRQAGPHPDPDQHRAPAWST